METVIVSGRVDPAVKERAMRYIQAAGLGVGDVIRTVLESIARTGEVPQPAVSEEDASVQGERLEAFRALRAGLPADPDLATMTDEQMRALVAERFETGKEAVAHA